MITIVDYDAGNMASVEKALRYLGYKVTVARNRDSILGAEKLVLPGVGAFGDAMGRLDKYGLTPVLKEAVAGQIPFLGICLGLQLLFPASEETPGTKGLGLLKGKINLIPKKEGLKIPQIGWNSLKVNPNSRLLHGIGTEPYVYFVHSYYLKADILADVSATAEYGIQIHAAVEKGNLFACQFHPEKSGEVGLAILENFARI